MLNSGRRAVSNAAWIIAARIVQALLNLVVTMLTARFLGPSNYGLINYAASLTAFFTPIMQLGLDAVMVQEIVNTPDEDGKIVGTAMCMSLASGFLSIVGVVSFAAIANASEPLTIAVCALYSLQLICQAVEIVQYWFQAKLLSKFTALISLIAYVIVSGYKIFLLITEKSVCWFAVAQAIDFLFIGIVLNILLRTKQGVRPQFSFDWAKRLFSKGKFYIISGIMITVYAQTDRVMLKLMIDETATGFYSAAVACAGITGFVFTAIIDSSKPLIFESEKTSKALFDRNVTLSYSLIIYLALAQSVIITCFAPFIVNVLYGAQYAPAVDALRIVVWYTTFSYIGPIRNTWMLAKNKQSLIWKLNAIGALSNIPLNLLLIPRMGINGAALASLITQIVTNLLLGFVIPGLRENNRLIVRSLHPAMLIDTVKSLLRLKSKR